MAGEVGRGAGLDEALKRVAGLEFAEVFRFGLESERMLSWACFKLYL